MNKNILVVSVLIALMGCGNDSGDKPTPLPELLPPPAGGFEPDFSGFETVASIDLSSLEALQGQDLIDGLEDQLNASLSARSAGSQFQITPQWGYDTNLRVINIDGHYALETTLAAQQIGKPSASEINGFSFKVSLPNGVVKEATLSYQINFSKPIGFADAAKSPDYIYLPGLTSGAPEVQNNKPTAAGTGFTYKFSTDRYGYLNAKYADALNGDLTNAQLQYGDKGITPTYGQWDLIQQNVQVNDFNHDAAESNGTVKTFFNREAVTTKTGNTDNRILVDETHPYNLQALVEIYRYYKHGSDDISSVGEQKVRIKNLSFAWNNQEVALPPPVDDQPDLNGFPNQVQLNLESLAGQNGIELFQGIEDQLNNALPEGTPAGQRFKITPKWGIGDGSAWDHVNLEVVNIQGQYVLQTTIAAEAVGQPSASKVIQNGFSFLIELPNGKVKEATMAYLYRLSTPLGNGDPSKSPDYITLPGLTSGSPVVPGSANTPSPNGTGFTYILNTTRDRTLNTRFIDATDSDFRNSAIKKNGQLVRIDSNLWHLVQQKLKTNDFLGNHSTTDGALDLIYKTDPVTPTAGTVTNRTQVDKDHNYNLSALMEVYRYWKHSLDSESDLKTQVVQLKNITFAWKDDVIAEPTTPPVNNCSPRGFTHSRLLDLSGLVGQDSQTIANAISIQLGNVVDNSASFSVERNNLSVVRQGSELALKITYAAGETGKNAVGNGASLTVDFPVTPNLNSACMAYDVKYELDVHANKNNDIVILPSLHIKDADTIFSEHNYVINHNKRLGTKFIADFLTWYDGSNKYLTNNKWYNTVQSLQFNPDTGDGTLDNLLGELDKYDAATHFKPIGNIDFNQVQHPVTNTILPENIRMVASFNSYRPDAARPGNADQTFYYKNIAIGWNTN